MPTTDEYTWTESDDAWLASLKQRGCVVVAIPPHQIHQVDRDKLQNALDQSADHLMRVHTDYTALDAQQEIPF